MNKTDFVIKLFPAFSALICLAIYVYSEQRLIGRKEKQVDISLSGYFLMTFFYWSLSIFSFHLSQISVFLYLLGCSLSMLTQIFLFRFIFTITRLPGDKAFSGWHYFFPVLFSIIGISWELTLSERWGEQSLQLATRVIQDNPLIDGLILSSTIIFLIYHAVYSLLAFIRIRKYRLRAENYVSQLNQTNVKWLDILIILYVILILLIVYAALVHKNLFISNRYLFMLAVLVIAQHVLIIYNSLIHNYVILEDIPEEIISDFTVSEEDRETPGVLGKKEFERFLSEKRPYTDKDLKISDLARELNTNRTYLSTFINNTYGMNFSSLINEYRIRYLEELRKNSTMKNKTNIELIYLAGFGSYQSYLRAKERNAKQSILVATFTK